ncbi:MAG: metallophosphoesterase family protein [Myxococcales bacterium]|nr:metallophosphoesterase family protein [Myxococcales bacterium]
MKIGIISDIHANLEALEAALSVYDRLPVDYLACLGDVVGYGAQPDECCDLVRKYADVTVLGNHDAAVCGRMDYSYYRAAAREALDWHARQLSEENMAWLCALPYNAHMESHGINFCHGSPLALEEFEYIFVLDQMRDVVAAFEEQTPVTFIGHSHLCKSFSYDAETAEEVLNTRFSLDPSRKYIITVGSVGQPRDYDTRACCAIYDTDERRFEYHRVNYDIEGAARKIFEAELSVAFGKRLFLGV